MEDIFRQLNKSGGILIHSEPESHITAEMLQISELKLIPLDTLKQKLRAFDNASVGAAVFTKEPPEDEIRTALLAVLKVLKPGGRVIFHDPSDKQQAKFDLTTNGFMNVNVLEKCVIATKPEFEPGSFVVLNLKQPQKVWKVALDDNEEEEDDTIDPDELLDEEDLKKPDPASLRVCGTTGQRKACKNCSCGLAEELETEQVKSAPKPSSCGNCYLGDAFRCSSCPYRGMPAFKPGEKIQLDSNQLKADI